LTLLRRSLFLVLICLAPLILAQAVNTWELRDSRWQEIQSRAVQQVVSASSDVNQLFEGFRQLLVTLTLTPSVRDQEPVSCRALLAKVAETNGNLANIGVADVNGRVVCTAGEAPEMIELARPPFSDALETGTFAVGDFRSVPAGSGAAVSMALPVGDESGATTGVVWATITPEALAKHLRTRALSPNALLIVSDRQGAIIASTPDEDLVGRRLPDSLASLVDSKTFGTVEAVGPDGVRRLFGFVPGGLRPDSQFTGQFVAVGIDKAASFEELDRATRRTVALIAIGVVFGLVAAFVGSRHFLQRPIDRLVQAARRWREGDLAARANLRPGSSEIAILGTAFDEMAGALASRTAELVEAKKRAEQRATEAEAAEQQKSLLLQEVNHRVKNSLQLVSSLLNLQAGTVREDDVRHHFNAAAARVQTIARVHARLFQTGQVHTVEFGQYLRDLCEDLGQTYAQQQQRPRFVVDVVRIELSTDRVIPLALVINELLTNVFKYAYPAGEEVRVHIESRREGEGALVVRVSDEGVGLPSEDELQRSGGLGMRLIHALVSQIDARLESERLVKGTRFTITVPLVSRTANGAAAA
jgi:two-component sensor histidine kinase